MIHDKTCRPNGHKLENFRIFPVVAWLLFIGFAVFAWTITEQLRATTENLEATTSHLQNLANTNPEDIEDFENLR